MGEKTDVWQGTLSLMVLRTMDSMGSQHGYGLPRRIEQTSGDLLQFNYGTLYPALLKVEQEGFIRSRRVPHPCDVLVLVAKVGNLDSNRAIPTSPSRATHRRVGDWLPRRSPLRGCTRPASSPILLH